MNTNELLVVEELQIPSHQNELLSIDDNIELLRYNINTAIKLNQLTDKVHNELFEEIVKTLVVLGNMSAPVFNTLHLLEEVYFDNFKKTPALCKKLWLEHYDKLHHPYTLRKNRCFTLIDNLDQGYMNKFKTNPPNWDI